MVYCRTVVKGTLGGPPVGNLNVLQINLHHCKDANEALFNYAINNNIDLILCQDPYILGGTAWHSTRMDYLLF